MALDLAAIAPGFADPVRDAQASFRRILDAMSHPGTRVALAPAQGDDAVGFGAVGALALTLLDFETPAWVGPGLRDGLADWLRFHCGCPLTGDPHAAAFAFADASALPDLDSFNAGDEKYPDRAATLVIAVSALDGGQMVALEGPGIRDSRTIAPQGLPAAFWPQARSNRARFQLGVDIVFAAGAEIIALPRSTRILEG